MRTLPVIRREPLIPDDDDDTTPTNDDQYLLDEEDTFRVEPFSADEYLSYVIYNSIEY